jgi:hypothetical protein
LLETKLLENLDFKTPFAPWLDRWLWAQLSFKNRFYFLNKKLTNWRLRDESYTMRTTRDIKKYELPFDAAINKVYKDNLPPAKYYFVKYLSQAFDLVFALFILPLKLLYRALNP